MCRQSSRVFSFSVPFSPSLVAAMYGMGIITVSPRAIWTYLMTIRLVGCCNKVCVCACTHHFASVQEKGDLKPNSLESLLGQNSGGLEGRVRAEQTGRTASLKERRPLSCTGHQRYTQSAMPGVSHLKQHPSSLQSIIAKHGGRKIPAPCEMHVNMCFFLLGASPRLWRVALLGL